jgi:hypothetical protein
MWPIDPREPDVREVERFLTAAARNGAVALPDLIAIDLCALGGAFQSVFDEPVWKAWVDLPDGYRDELAGDAFRGLVGRRLMDPPHPEPEAGGEPVARIAPPLALIMMIRSRPAFVVQCALDGEQRGAPRMYGIAEAGTGVRAVLVERASNERIGLGVRQHVTLSPAEDRARADDLHQLYKYLLLSPERAVQVLASWLSTDQPPGERVLDVYHHRDGEPMTRSRMTALSRPGQPGVVNRDGRPVEHDVAGEVTRMVILETTQ